MNNFEKNYEFYLSLPLTSKQVNKVNMAIFENLITNIK